MACCMLLPCFLQLLLLLQLVLAPPLLPHALLLLPESCLRLPGLPLCVQLLLDTSVSSGAMLLGGWLWGRCGLWVPLW